MPNIGDIARAKDIGYSGRALFQYRACPTCDKKKVELRILEKRVTLLEAENARLNALLSGVQDSDNSKDMNMNRYNTPAVQGDLPESIVRAFSNEGDNDFESV